jgi:hypothetical protein
MVGPSLGQEQTDSNDEVRDHEVDLFDDTASHSPKSQPQVAPREPPIQRGAPPVAAQLERAPLTAPPETSPMLSDPAYFEQLVKAILLGIIVATSSTSRETTHTLVHWVKNINDMGCLPFLEDKNAEVTGQ